MSTGSKTNCSTNEKLLSSSSDSISSLCSLDSKSKSYDSLKEIWDANKKEDNEDEIKNNLKDTKINNYIKNVKRREKNSKLIKMTSSPTIKDAIKIVTRVDLSPSWGIDNDYFLNYE
tara:strand:+ start:165 stop:515 length:351 start_codon:yes stop_codon:yes gene_type:complete